MEITNHLIATELLLYLYYKSENNITITSERLEILLDSSQHLLFSNTPDFIQRHIAHNFVAKYCTPDNRNQYLFIKAVQEQINNADQDIDIEQILRNIESIANQYLNAENVISTLKKFKKHLKKKTITPPDIIKKRQLCSYVITGFIIIIGIFSIIYEPTISGDQLFKQKSLTFTSFDFNSEAVYKTSLPNPVNKEMHLLKQAIFYLQGEASISFNPADLQYNEKTGVLTYFYKPNHIFDIHTNQNITLIDQLPLITIENPINSMVGVVTTGTNKNEEIQYYLNEILSKNKTTQLISHQESIAIDGSTLPFITNQELDQLKKSLLLSTAEIQAIEPLAITILQAVLLNDQTLQNYFRAVFEEYLRAMYATQEIHLEKIVYKELKK